MKVLDFEVDALTPMPGLKSLIFRLNDNLMPSASAGAPITLKEVKDDVVSDITSLE